MTRVSAQAERYLKACGDLAISFGRHPRDSLRTLRLLPRTVQGAWLARHWEDGAQAAPLLPAEQGGPGRLREFLDGHTEGRGVWKWEHYVPIYERHFGKFVGHPVQVAEVGVLAGGSLEMWRAYFGPQSQVYGVDIEEACKAAEGDHIRVFIGDQGDRRFWAAFWEAVPTLDVVIDDGGHQPQQQIVTFEETFPHLRPGGVYLCEDIFAAYNPFAGYVLGLANELNASVETGPQTITRGIQRWARSIHLYPYVTVIEKADRPAERLREVRRGTAWDPDPRSRALPQ